MADEFEQYKRKPTAADDEFSQYKSREGKSQNQVPARPTISVPMTNFPMQPNGQRSETPQVIRAGTPPLSTGFGEGLMRKAIPLESIMKLGRGIGNSGEPWQERISDVGEGAAGAMAPMVLPSLISRPLSTLAGGALGFGTGKIGGGVSSLLGGSPETNRLAENVSGAVGGPLAARGLGSLMERAAPGVYGSALKPLRSKVRDIPGRNEVIKTGLEEGLPVSEGGVESGKNQIESLNQSVLDSVRANKNNALIDPRKVAQSIRGLPAEFNSVTPESARTDIASAKNEYLGKHTEQVPFTKIRPGIEEERGRFVSEGEGKIPTIREYSPEEAQLEKQATYKDLRANYGQRSGPYQEAQKGLAHGLRSEISKAVPEVEPLNERESRLIKWLGVAEPRVMTAANREGFTFNVPHTIARAIESPAIKSRFAIGLNRAGRPLRGGSGTIGAAVLPLATK